MPYQIVTDTTLSFGVDQICALVGYPKAPDVAGSTDQGIQQMVAAMNQASAELSALREWQELVQPMTIQVIADFAGQTEKAFPLPVDYSRMVDQTQWSQGQMWPAIGPVSAQGWASYLVRNWAPTLSLFWQIRNDKIWFMRPPFPVAAPFTCYYVSRGSVTDQDDPLLIKNIASKNGDTFLLDGLLIILFARMKWLEYKGFDTSSAARDYQTQYDSRAGNDRGAPVLSLSMSQNYPLIGIGNIPDTGIGM